MASLDANNPSHLSIIAQARAIAVKYGDDAITDRWLRANDKFLHANIVKHRIHFKNLQAYIGVVERKRERMWQEALSSWRKLYDKHGSKAFMQKWYRENGYMSLRNKTGQCNRDMDDVIMGLGIEGLMEDVHEFRKPTIKYEKEEFEIEAQKIIETYRCLPSARFLENNGHSKFSHNVSRFGPTFEAIRQRYGVDNLLLTSIDGKKWLSFAEVCLVNFLLARKIKVLPGRRYADSWSSFSGKSYGVYDMHFVANHGRFANQEMSVEVFGGGPRGNSVAYQNTKALKIKYHENNQNFIYLDFQDCYKESKLKVIMSQYIKEDLVELPTPDFPTTMLSTVDYVLRKCTEIMKVRSDDVLPSLAWFNRDGDFKDRNVESWEPRSWAGFVQTLHSIGIRTVRTLLNQAKPVIINSKYKNSPKAGFQYKGVHKRNKHSWRAIFHYKNVRYDFGTHESAKKAALAYNAGVKRLNVIDAYMNIVSEDEE